MSPIQVPQLGGLFLSPDVVVSPLFFRDGNWRICECDEYNRMTPSHWAAIVDEEPAGTFQFKFDWIKASNHPPPVGGVVWARGGELRLALFDGHKWREHPGYGEIEAPDWWANCWATLC